MTTGGNKLLLQLTYTVFFVVFFFFSDEDWLYLKVHWEIPQLQTLN